MAKEVRIDGNAFEIRAFDSPHDTWEKLRELHKNLSYVSSAFVRGRYVCVNLNNKANSAPSFLGGQPDMAFPIASGNDRLAQQLIANIYAMSQSGVSPTREQAELLHRLATIGHYQPTDGEEKLLRPYHR